MNSCTELLNSDNLTLLLNNKTSSTVLWSYVHLSSNSKYRIVEVNYFVFHTFTFYPYKVVGERHTILTENTDAQFSSDAFVQPILSFNSQYQLNAFFPLLKKATQVWLYTNLLECYIIIKWINIGSKAFSFLNRFLLSTLNCVETVLWRENNKIRHKNLHTCSTQARGVI